MKGKSTALNTYRSTEMFKSSELDQYTFCKNSFINTLQKFEV